MCEAANMRTPNTCCLISQSGQLPGSHAAQGPRGGRVRSPPVQTVGAPHVTRPPPLHNQHTEQT